MAKQAEAAAADPFSSIRGLWAGCAACHGNEGQGMGAFPKLAGQNAEYISQRLYAYQNRETIGAMSATMWAQAGMLSDNDIQTLSEFIEENNEMSDPWKRKEEYKENRYPQQLEIQLNKPLKQQMKSGTSGKRKNPIGGRKDRYQ